LNGALLVNCLGPSLCVDCLNVCFLYFVYDFIIIIIIIIIIMRRCAHSTRDVTSFWSLVGVGNGTSL